MSAEKDRALESGPASWDELAAVFEGALACPSETRAEWLAAACPSPALRAEVEAMLREHEVPLSLERRFLAAAASVVAAPAEKEGVLVGAYRLDRLLGRGGMGEVYLASRADGQYEGKVAVKLLPAGFAGPDRERRLRQERQILASLRHPGIATLLDGGVTAEGQPYLVMDHVDGEPIDRYCDHHRLPIADRLLLFARVCDAVQYAHARLVVHRDIKPSNLLVDRAGTPRLLDFGIAKLLDPAAEPADATLAGHRLFTPLRAAPEQIRGEPISTATDVYGLGVLLFELLTGSLPFRARSGDAWEAYRAVCEDEPMRPSAALAARGESGRGAGGADVSGASRLAELSAARQLAPAQLRRALRGDLESIVARALAKAPEARYPSAGALAEEVRRYLRGEPVAVRRQTWLYRGGKFVRRHALPVAAIGLAVAALGVASMLTLASARRAERERDNALAGERRARAAMNVLVDVFSLTDPSVGPAGDQVSVEGLLARAERRASALGDPLLTARLLYDLGRIQRERTQYRAAADILERARRQARLAGDEALLDDVDLQLGITRRELREPERARSLLGGVVQRRHARLGRDAPLSLEAERELALVRSPVEAVPPLVEVLARQRRARGVDPRALAETLNALCFARAGSGDVEGALSDCEAALELLRRTGRDSTPQALTVLNNVSTLVSDPRRQEEVQRRRLGIAAALYGSESDAVALAWNNLGVALGRQGRLLESEEAFAKGLALYEKRYGAGHPVTASTLRNVGRMRQLRGYPEQALPLLRRALSIAEANRGEARAVAGLRMQVARATWVVERSPAALAAMRAATAEVLALPTPQNDRYRADALTLLGMSLVEAGKACEAVEPLRDAQERHARAASAKNAGYALETRCALRVAEDDCGPGDAAELVRCRRELSGWGLADPELLARLR